MQVEMPINRFKRALAQGRRQIGMWASLVNPVAVEALAGSGLDWLVIDAEHSVNEPADIQAALQAMQTGTASAVVRPPWNDFVTIKRYLDAGAQSLLIPMVQSVDEAKAAVDATRYPPRGIRGVAGTSRATRFGRVKDYFARADDEMCVVVQIETKKGLDVMEAISAVDGVDGVFIGPSDLSCALGHLGNPLHPEVQAVIQAAPKRMGGKPVGILTPNETDAKRYIDWGYSFVAVGMDVGVLARHSEGLAQRLKQ